MGFGLGLISSGSRMGSGFLGTQFFFSAAPPLIVSRNDHLKNSKFFFLKDTFLFELRGESIDSESVWN